MKHWKPIVSTLALSMVVALPLMAQPGGSTPAPKPATKAPARVSPGEVTSTVVDGNRVTLVYSRPYTKDPKTGAARKIWGGLVPYGQVWRAGANEATLLITQQPIEIGGATVPAGAYSLFMLPVEGGPSKLIINKQIGQWGSQYDDKQDLARVDLVQSATPESVDQFTMRVAKEAAGGGTLTLAWENLQFTVPYSVKK
ncbi:MAG: DUF2911 domain-containing protein [Phycisphaeraceae bacterium]|nr:DUF2911 domain-containing protein [Phycisphaeraceae bacterium]